MIPRNGHDPLPTDDGYECADCGSVTMSKPCPDDPEELEYLIRAAEREVEDGQARWSETGSTSR